MVKHNLNQNNCLLNRHFPGFSPNGAHHGVGGGDLASKCWVLERLGPQRLAF